MYLSQRSQEWGRTQAFDAAVKSHVGHLHPTQSSWVGVSAALGRQQVKGSSTWVPAKHTNPEDTDLKNIMEEQEGEAWKKKKKKLMTSTPSSEFLKASLGSTGLSDTF